MHEELQEEETATKREREGGGELWERWKAGSARLRSNFYVPTTYTDLVEGIVREIRNMGVFRWGRRGSIGHGAAESLCGLSTLLRPLLFFTFREVSNASYSRLLLSVDLAKQIASASGNKPLTDADRARAQEMANGRIRKEKEKIEQMREEEDVSEENLDFAADQKARSIRLALEDLEKLERQGVNEDAYKEIQAKKLEPFVENYKNLFQEYGIAAARSFLALPSSQERAILNLGISIKLQEVSADYNPIAEPRHMDGELDMFVAGARYGRPASEQDGSYYLPNARIISEQNALRDAAPVTIRTCLFSSTKRSSAWSTPSGTTRTTFSTPLGRCMTRSRKFSLRQQKRRCLSIRTRHCQKWELRSLLLRHSYGATSMHSRFTVPQPKKKYLMGRLRIQTDHPFPE